jgi:hypothetical protein
MNTFFKVIRYILSIILIIPLFLLLIVSPPLITISQTVAYKENLKTVLDQSKIYDNLIDTAIPILTQSSGESEETAKLFEEGSDFRIILDQELTPTEIKSKVDTVIDSVYDWLEEKTLYPQFDIHLIESDQAVKDIFSSILITRLEDLPTCSTNNQLEIVMQNPMEAECIPANFNSEEVKTLVDENITEEQINEFKQQFRFSSEDINWGGENTQLYKNLFIILRWLYIILTVLISVLTILILLLIPGWKESFLTLSVLYLISGLIWLVTSLIDISTRIEAQVETAFIDLFNPLFLILISKMRVVALITLTIGILFLILGIVIKKKNPKTKQL